MCQHESRYRLGRMPWVTVSHDQRCVDTTWGYEKWKHEFAREYGCNEDEPEVTCKDVPGFFCIAEYTMTNEHDDYAVNENGCQPEGIWHREYLAEC